MTKQKTTSEDKLTSVEIRYKILLNEWVDNGFTEEQAHYLINLLNSYFPII